MVSRLAAELLLPESVCRLLVARGHGAPETAKRYLRPRLDQLHDPGLMAQLDRAVERVVRALSAAVRRCLYARTRARSFPA